MWEVTTWDKKFSGIDKSMQPNIIKYHYYLANELAALERQYGDVRILYTTEKVAFADIDEVKDNVSEGEVVAIPWGGNVSIKYYKGKFITADNRIATSNNKEILDNKFLYYWMEHKKDEIESFYRGAGIKHPSMHKVLTMLIPLPTLSEQKRIVDYLDTFTSSIDNLKQQIAERRKQFEYYCDQYYGGDYNGMMAFSNNPGCSVVPFSELGTITRGKRFVRDDVRESGQPCIHYGDMYTYYGTKAHQANTFLDRDFPKKMRYAHKGDVVIVGAGENDYDIGVGVVWLGDEPAAVHDACYILEHNLNPMYISYYLRSNIYHQQLKKFVSSGKISSFSAEGLGKVLIPIQSKEKQQEIVSALETFEVSISKLEQMVELRQKQYEYYREKLLTFE